MYTFSQETKDALRKFRLGTSRAQKPQAKICKYVLLDVNVVQTRPSRTIGQSGKLPVRKGSHYILVEGMHKTNLKLIESIHRYDRYQVTGDQSCRW